MSVDVPICNADARKWAALNRSTSYRCSVPLPPDARQRLVAPLRTETFGNVSFRAAHTLPVTAQSWELHSTALSTAVAGLATTTPSLANGYEDCRRSVARTKELAYEALSQLLAIQPFVPFDHTAAERLVTLIVRRLEVVADYVELDVDVAIDEELLAESQEWAAHARHLNARSAVGDAFAMSDPPIDDSGRFRPEWVLQHYAYRTNDLLHHLLPHLASLGVPGLPDVLAAVIVVGEILACDDSVGAYVHMDEMIASLLTADPATGAEVREHLSQMEPAIRRARDAAARSWRTVRDVAADTETRANALADCYKRLVEGPFRQLAWVHHCLNLCAWERPPTLGVLRDRMVAAGGRSSVLAAQVIIPDLRNSEAHETLVWDGFDEQFSAEGVLVLPQKVVESAQVALSFVAGCEAAIAAVRFLELPADIASLPHFGEQGRMPGWKRVQSFFGTNDLRLLDAILNTRHASLRVGELLQKDVNPCFQALVLSHRLMPNIESFAVRVNDNEPLIVVTAGALAASMPAWEFAVSNLDQIPLATFLPTNLDARMRHEQDSTAIRSAAWIAVDDAVGVIDGSSATWSDADRRLIGVRLRVVEISVQNTVRWLTSGAVRLTSVAASVASLRQWISDESPKAAYLAERRHEMARLRSQWETWGPIPRHPLVADDQGRDVRDENEHQPRLRDVPESSAFRTL
ncbi:MULTISPECIES: hypothetical protein [unclassified Mycobacterium]|uniref:hypothetical protein n=1 Tax=unclassified Mycobacterium TaxID=2642494 RepID=UPI0029C7AF76|nr:MULTISPECIES: hypothetical protein [unclassified Mycobacterium]